MPLSVLECRLALISVYWFSGGKGGIISSGTSSDAGMVGRFNATLVAPAVDSPVFSSMGVELNLNLGAELDANGVLLARGGTATALGVRNARVSLSWSVS